MYLPKTKEKEKEKEVTTPAMHYPADVPAYIASIDSGLGRRNIDSIVSTESSGYSWIPAHIPLLDLGMHSPAVSAGISQRVLSRAADGQKRQYGRSSRWIQSIAATGTSMATMSKSRRHGLYLSSQQGFTDDSSIDGSDRHKISIVDLVASHSDPMIVAKKAEKLDDALSIRTGSLNVGCIESTTGSLQHVKTASDALSAERQDTHESSVLWMHSTFSEKEHREQHQQQGARTQSDPAFISNGTSSNMQGVGGASNAFVDTSKFMFYSSQTGAVLSSSLVKPVFGDLGIDSLIDIILGHEAELAEGNSPCFWLDIAGASAQEIEDLCDIFELHPLSTQDIVNGCPRDKIDVFGNYTFIAYSTIAYGTGSGRPQSSRYGESSSNILQWSEQPNNLMAKHLGCDCKSSAKRGQIFIAMRSNYVVTFHCGHQRSVVHQVLERLDAMKRAALIVNNDDDDDDDDGRSHKNSSIASMPPYTKEEPLSGLVDFPAYIVYAILDEITDQLSPEILAIEQNVDAIDELVLVLSHNEHENMLQRMGEQRRRILTTWQVVQPKAEIVETLAQMLRTRLWTGSENLAEEVAQYLGDVHGHLAAAIGSCTRAEAVLSRSHANYLAKISLELSRATFDSNSTTERWTMLGTIVVPINIVTSFLGVNLKVPGQDRDDTLNFFIVMACMVVYAAATLAFWRWRRII
ncbi:CorA metal ion transporter [Coemansia erecta]|nr:CorA metal ion transporter [Coemansia erecta]